MEKRFPFYALTSLIVCFVLQLPAIAAEKKFVFAPVFFVTDRVSINEKGKVRFTDDERALTNTAGGIRYVAVESRVDIQETWPYLQSIGWKDVSDLAPAEARMKLGTKQDAQIAADSLSQYEMPDNMVIAKIKQLPGFSGQAEKKPEVIFYIHGFFNDFFDATNTAADLSSCYKRPTIAYCWMTPKHQFRPNPLAIPQIGIKLNLPVPGFVQSYRESEVTHQHSQERINAFLFALDYAFHPPNMILVAHSMGSRLLDQALINRHGFYGTVKPEEKYSSVVMSNPDIDGRFFTSHAQELCDETSLFRVFFVKSDIAMSLSKFLHGAHYRLGAANESIFAQLRHTPVQLVDVTELGSKNVGLSGHDMSCWVLANFHKYQTVDKNQESYWEEKPNKNDSLTIVHRKKQ